MGKLHEGLEFRFMGICSDSHRKGDGVGEIYFHMIGFQNTSALGYLL